MLQYARAEPVTVWESEPPVLCCSMQEQNLSELENLNPLQLTAWEQWMLRKAKLDREKRISDVRQVAKDKEDGVKVQHEKEEKDKRVQEQLSQWCLKKRMDNDLKKLKVSRGTGLSIGRNVFSSKLDVIHSFIMFRTPP